MTRWTKTVFSPESGRSKNNQYLKLRIARLTHGGITVALSLHRDLDHARGDNGGDGMFINHLTHCIFEQNHKLVEGLDLTLQFDPAYQVDLHWNPFFTKHI